MNQLIHSSPEKTPARLVPPMPAAEIAALFRHERQVEMPLTHHFQPGVYIREIFMPAGTLVVGYQHRTRHLNIVLTGRCEVRMEGEAEDATAQIAAPAVFESEGGVQKVLFIHEDCRWLTIHANPDDCTDIATIEERLIEIAPEILALKGSADIDTFRMSVNQPPTINHPHLSP